MMRTMPWWLCLYSPASDPPNRNNWVVVFIKHLYVLSNNMWRRTSVKGQRITRSKAFDGGWLASLVDLCLYPTCTQHTPHIMTPELTPKEMAAGYDGVTVLIMLLCGEENWMITENSRIVCRFLTTLFLLSFVDSPTFMGHITFICHSVQHSGV